jgi:hypothetical protein
MQDAIEYARRLAADAALWQRIAAEGPGAADAEWQRAQGALRQILQQLEGIYKLVLTASDAQVFFGTPVEGTAWRRAPAQILADEYTMPADNPQWRLRGTQAFTVVLGEGGNSWLWRGADGALFSSEGLANYAVLNLLARERAHRGLPEVPS